MYIDLVVGVLGLAAACSATVAEQHQHCDSLMKSCVLEEPESIKNSERSRNPLNMSVLDWSSPMVRNETVKSENSSEFDEYLQQKIRTEFETAAKLIDEDKIKISDEEAAFVSALSQKFFSIHAPFNPAYSEHVSQKCKRASKAYLHSLGALEMWALRMHDASGKLTSGLLNGNINQFGDYDQCLGVRSATGETDLQGRYCLAGIQPSVKPGTVLLQHVFNLAQSHGMLKSELDDPGHRVPRFSTINWALCVPAACSSRDIRLSLTAFLKDYTKSTGLQLKVSVEPELCEVKNAVWDRYYTPATKTVWIGFIAYIAIVMLSTLYEYKSGTENQWLTAFSLIRNTRTIFCVKEDLNDVACIHGIRFLNAFLLILAHKSMALFFNPYTNRTDMSETLGQPWSVIGRAASIFTDPFIMFSGFLTAYAQIGRLLRGQRVKTYQEYIGRILRIAPPLGALILFCTFVLPFLGSGPQWNLVVTNHGDICKKYWWRNMLFIHNYFGFKNMCLTHTHHVGIDTELFLASPLFIWLIWKWPRKGSCALIILALMTTVHRFYVTYKLRLSNYVYFGTSVKQLFDTADYMYIIPYYRLTVYLMGVMLGYACRTYKSIRLTPNQLRLGWYASSFLLALAFFGPAPMGSMGYVYNPVHAANYAAFSPIAWCIFFAWAVFTSHLGYRNKLTDLFSWRGFRVTTKVSYAVYLTQFPIFFYNVGRIRNAQHYNFFTSILLDLNEYIVIFGASYLLTVLFETPFSNIKRLLFDSKKPRISQRSSNQDDVKDTVDINENSSKTIVYPSNHTKDLKD